MIFSKRISKEINNLTKTKLKENFIFTSMEMSEEVDVTGAKRS